jgi:quinol---cytochrome c reductase iron-sulfur subunit, bacillus type
MSTTNLETDDSKPNRRGFCCAVIYAFGSLIGAALAVPAAVYLFLPPRTRKESQWVDAGDLTQLEPHQPQEVTFRRTRVDGWKVTSEKATAWVVKMSEQKVVAFSPWCTHLGCAYHWDAQKNEFLCPCHGSVFGIDGKVLAGPAPRPLDRYDVKVENTRLWLGPIRKSGETAS